MALTTVNTEGITNGTIKDEDVKNDAAIAGSKIAPDFGSQNITTTGLIEVASTSCHIDLMETSTTNHRIRNGSGNFHIQRISDDKNTTENQLVIDGGTGAVELHYDGDSKKLETKSWGVDITGDCRATELKLETNKYLSIGSSNELRLYHDESSSIIYENGTGPLNIQTNNSNINIKGGGSAAHDMAIFKSTEGCEFYYNNSKKFETTDEGAVVTGELRVGGNEGGYKTNIIRESSDTTTATTQLLLYSKHDGSGNTGVGFGGGIRFWGDRNGDNAEQNMGRIMCIADVNSGTNISGALVFETAASGSNGEGLRITSGKQLYLGPYKTSTTGNNVPYEIRVAPYAWGSSQDLAAISMGNHSGATGSDDGQIVFKTALNCHTDASALQERLRILSQGGITFNGETAVANALDHYEEGTFVPTLGGSTGDPTQDYAHKLGSFVRIGNLVHVSFDVKMASSGVSAGSGVLLLGSLPYTKGSHTGGTPSHGCTFSAGFTENLGSDHPTAAFIDNGNNYLWMRKTSSSSSAYCSATAITNSTRIIAGATYITTQ